MSAAEDRDPRENMTPRDFAFVLSLMAVMFVCGVGFGMALWYR